MSTTTGELRQRKPGETTEPVEKTNEKETAATEPTGKTWVDLNLFGQHCQQKDILFRRTPWGKKVSWRISVFWLCLLAGLHSHCHHRCEISACALTVKACENVIVPMALIRHCCIALASVHEGAVGCLWWIWWLTTVRCHSRRDLWRLQRRQILRLHFLNPTSPENLDDLCRKG